MEKYLHKLLRIYPDRRSADAACFTLQRAGFGRAQIAELRPADEHLDTKVEPEPDAVERDIVRDLLAGAGLGLLGGAALTAALEIQLPDLFAIYWWLGPAAIIVYGIAVGSTVGALFGLNLPEGWLSAIARDDVDGGAYGLVFHARDLGELDRAQGLLGKRSAIGGWRY